MWVIQTEDCPPTPLARTDTKLWDIALGEIKMMVGWVRFFLHQKLHGFI